jgi:hypothetical protein
MSQGRVDVKNFLFRPKALVSQKGWSSAKPLIPIPKLWSSSITTRVVKTILQLVAPSACKMQNTFQEPTLFKQILAFQAPRHQLQPDTHSFSTIWPAINPKAKPGIHQFQPKYG